MSHSNASRPRYNSEATQWLIENTPFTSMSQAAEESWLSRTSIKRQIQRNRGIDTATAEGVRAWVQANTPYDTVTELAAALGQPVERIRYRVEHHIPLDRPVQPPRKPFTYKGVPYPTKTAFAEAHGLTLRKFSQYIHRGLSVAQIVGDEPLPTGSRIRLKHLEHLKTKNASSETVTPDEPEKEPDTHATESDTPQSRR